MNKMKRIYLEFEKDIEALDLQMSELKTLNKSKGISFSPEIKKLQKLKFATLKKTYKNLTPWETVQVSKHPQRPILQDYLKYMINDFKELHGDKYFGDDKSLICGLGEIGREKVMIIGHNKGKTTEENIERNFGSAHPEGYRKALSKMKFAEKFNIPVITFIDTPGAYPGMDSEERGISRSISRNMFEMSKLKVPIICVVIGEGGSGGALGIGVGDKLSMLEYSYYSVISPEGCSAILWKDGQFASEAAKSLKLTSKELLKLSLVDEVIGEPLGGAHRSYHDTFFNVKMSILKNLRSLKRFKMGNLLKNRYAKLRSL